MYECLVMYKDEDGLPRAYATGTVGCTEDLDEIKAVAKEMLKRYAESKPYPVDVNTFSLSITGNPS